MTRRSHDEQLELGSDSFLDIIANIVGILIILIVIAGVRVSRQPLDTGGAETQIAVVPTAVAAAEEQPEPAPVRVLPVPRRPQQVERQPDPTDSADPETRVPFAAAELEAKLEQSRRQEREVRTRLASMATQTAALTQDSRSRLSGLEEVHAEVAAVRRSIESDDEEAGRLQAMIAENEQDEVQVEQIEHRVTPLGKEVTGNELHFRVSGGRVAFVPVERLLDALREQARKHQSWLLQHPSHQGVVGPIRGFRMSYTVTRQRPSLRDELLYGNGVFRVIVSEWEIEPTGEVESETLQQASQPGSLFAARLLEAELDDTLTFWVYPDSFPVFRELQKLAHAEGFTVAGRPLPHGVQIAGSPNGSRSSGQ